MRKSRAFCLCLLWAASSCATYPTATPRPESWASPVAGVPNLYKVDGNLYRSAQPGAEGMKAVAALGVRTVIDLRGSGDDAEEIAGTNLRRVDIPMRASHPDPEVTRRFLETVSHEENGPFLVHCYHGSDRTGSMVAIYRVRKQGWTTDEALCEMTRGGFGYHRIWHRLIGWTRAQAQL